MFRRRTYHHHRTNNYERRGFVGILRHPATQVAILIVAGVAIYLIALAGNETAHREVGVDGAYQLVQQGATILDVREQKEWDLYHAPNSVFIPLEQLSARLNEVPRDVRILVVCSSARCSQQGRDILLSGGFAQATSMNGSMQDWYQKGYPIEGAPPQ